MARVSIVPEQDWAVLRKYLGETGVVLIPESAMSDMPKEKQEKLKELDGKYVDDYGFGSEPDVMVDIVLTEDAYFMGEIMGEEDEDDE